MLRSCLLPMHDDLPTRLTSDESAPRVLVTAIEALRHGVDEGARLARVLSRLDPPGDVAVLGTDGRHSTG
jgi:hypothetical protein